MTVKKRLFFLLFLGFLTGSCNLLNEPEEKEVIARVNDAYLYRDDVATLISANTSPEDSTLLVNNFITRWATQKLLLDRARVNLSSEQQAEFDRLVQNYKNELYAKAYTDAIVARELDTSISREAAEAYYEENGENFFLNENLVKVRYINITKNNKDFETIKKRFIRFNQEDRQALLDMAIQFNSYSLNDSVWVKTKQVYDKIRPLTPQDNPEFLKNKNFMQLEDSLGVYLVSVEDVKLRNEQAPLEYSLPGIKQILLNKRKLDLIKKLEKDITQDAIKNDEFEIYN
ncbi:peptidyl-prolyl cis-trans isomerase [Salinimicrobium sp. MT39]|uniref:Peptidyl-prolyl cis-trans isomerase n=1 Tax=Salinimicrobium profundisediminis TaxID=2994553 RepID=A0A9X3I1J6_9FLAO|nr:peptidyl-prolyl cis-trans isomerase [Salinimicrobium profundisediminis]MCX2838669.1 peptidyl-prolyl cis-trans isomerase [Salinimicrobium profundisediminis]